MKPGIMTECNRPFHRTHKSARLAIRWYQRAIKHIGEIRVCLLSSLNNRVAFYDLLRCPLSLHKSPGQCEWKDHSW